MSVVNSPQTRRPILSSSFKDKLQQILYQFFSILFIFMAISLGLIMFSYHIGDPSFRNIPNEPANNIFGAFGSHIADPLHLGLGLSYKFLLFLMLLWSWRLTFDKNKRKMIIRLIFFPLPLATTAIFLATYPPSPEWNLSFSYGLGGIFGDTILKYILQAAFLDSNTILRLTSAACALLTLSLSVAVTATSLKELTKLTKFFFSSLLYGMKMVHYIFYNNFKKKDLILLFIWKKKM